MPKIRGFKIARFNIASLPKHIDESRIVMSNNEIDVLASNESRMDSTIPIVISVYDYSWLANIQIDLVVHGAGFFIRDTINYRIRLDLDDIGIEILTDHS